MRDGHLLPASQDRAIFPEREVRPRWDKFAARLVLVIASLESFDALAFNQAELAEGSTVGSSGS
jgi:hypothetical protein